MKLFAAVLCFLACVAGQAAAQGITIKPVLTTTGDASNTTVLASGGSTARTLSARAADVVNASDYGVVCDYDFGSSIGTDNTAALGAAIFAAESSASQGAGKRLIVPSGACLTGPQTIAGQLEMQGSGSSPSVLVLKSGSSASAITVALTGYNFPGDGHPFAEVYIKDIRVTSQDTASNHASYPNAAAFHFVTGYIGTFAYLDHVTIYNMPGDGISGGAFNGFVQASFLYSHENGGNGVSLNSTNDWTFSDGQIDGNHLNGILSSGDSSLTIHHMNVFSNTQAGVELFGRETVTLSGHNEFNLNGTAGLQLYSLTSDARIKVVNELGFGSNSQVASANYPAVQIYGGAGIVEMFGSDFPAPYSVNNQNSELANFSFQNSTTTQVFCLGCIFEGGATNWSATTDTSTQPQTFSTLSLSPSSAAIFSDVTLQPITVANLPPCSSANAGRQFYDTDLISPTYNGTLSGGGSVARPVTCTNNGGSYAWRS